MRHHQLRPQHAVPRRFQRPHHLPAELGLPISRNSDARVTLIRTPRNDSVWRKVSQLCPVKPRSMTAPQRNRTLTPLYCRPVDALFGMANDAFAAAVPQGLHPRHAASLQFGDDLVGDFIKEARRALGGARPNSVFRHRGSPRRAPRHIAARRRCMSVGPGHALLRLNHADQLFLGQTIFRPDLVNRRSIADCHHGDRR